MERIQPNIKFIKETKRTRKVKHQTALLAAPHSEQTTPPGCAATTLRRASLLESWKLGEHLPIPMDLNLIFRIKIAIYVYPLCSSPWIMWGNSLSCSWRETLWNTNDLGYSEQGMRVKEIISQNASCMVQSHKQSFPWAVPLTAPRSAPCSSLNGHQVVRSQHVSRLPALILPVSSKTCLLTCAKGQWRSVDVSASGYSRYFSNSPGFVGISGGAPAMFVREPLLFTFAAVQWPQAHGTSLRLQH